MIETVPYETSLRGAWDSLVDQARNGHFLFRRDYLEYHADRFPDASFLFRENGKWLGLVAGHLWGDEGWASHKGLTFGGLVLSSQSRTPQVREMLNGLHARLRERGRTVVRWKPLPWFHAREPSQEDLYFLFRLRARLVSRTLGTLVEPRRMRLSPSRLRICERSRREGLRVERRDDWQNFWPILERNLGDRHDTRPVHSLDEIRLLASRFPENIQLFGALQDDQWHAGIVVFRTAEVFHVQYSAATDEGRTMHAPNLLALELGQVHAAGSSRWMSFGNSCERGGDWLNDGLLAFKESHGGHGVVYEEYEYSPDEIPVDAP